MGDLVSSLLKLRPIQYRGRTSSADVASMFEEVADTLQDVTAAINGLKSSFDSERRVLRSEVSELRERVRQMGQLHKYIIRRHAEHPDESPAIDNYQLAHDVIDGRRTELMRVPTGMAIAYQLSVSPRYGQMTVPLNDVASRFWTTNPATAELHTLNGVSAAYSAVDEGTPLKVIAGDTSLCLDGMNENYWIRQLFYPLEDDRKKVEGQIVISVPATTITRANILVLHPFPLGTVDITAVEYDTGSGYTALPNFTDTKQAGHTRIFFQDIDGIQKIRITMECRKPIEHNGFKLFQFGLQEAGLYLASFEQAQNGDTNYTTSPGILFKLDAPDGYHFLKVYDIFPEGYEGAGGDITNVRFHLFDDLALTTELYDSVGGSLPVTISGGEKSAIYLFVRLQRPSSSKVTPVLEQVLLEYEIEKNV